MIDFTVPTPKDRIDDVPFDTTTKQTPRDEIGYRYDLIEPGFLEEIARTLHEASIRYGEKNYHQKPLIGNASPINHILAHVNDYLHDKNPQHLINIALNAMMEHYHVGNT